MVGRPDPLRNGSMRVARQAFPVVMPANRAGYVRCRTYKAAPGADHGVGRGVAGHAAPLSDSGPKTMGAQCSKI